MHLPKRRSIQHYNTIKESKFERIIQCEAILRNKYSSFSSFRIHHMSYLFYTIFGGATAIVVGSLTSLVCKEKFEKVLNPMLFSPFVRKFLNTNDDSRRSCVTHAFETMYTQPDTLPSSIIN